MRSPSPGKVGEEAGDVVVGDQSSKPHRRLASPVGVERIGSSLTQQRDELAVAPGIEDGHEEGRVAEAVGLVDLRTSVEKDGGGGPRAALGRQVERGEPLPVAEVDGVTRGQARLDRGDVPVERRAVKGEPAEAVRLDQSLSARS